MQPWLFCIPEDSKFSKAVTDAWCEPFGWPTQLQNCMGPKLPGGPMGLVNVAMASEQLPAWTHPKGLVEDSSETVSTESPSFNSWVSDMDSKAIHQDGEDGQQGVKESVREPSQCLSWMFMKQGMVKGSSDSVKCFPYTVMTSKIQDLALHRRFGGQS